MNKSVVIFGTGNIAEVAHYYFTRQSSYNVAAFTVDSAYVDSNRFCGLPVIPFEEILKTHVPDSYHMFIALSYSRINTVREEKYLSAKKMGYAMANFISAQATVLNDNMIGDNCFILENNTVQPFVKIGNNVTLWSGNHIGHHSTIGDNCFISSHVVVSGGVKVEKNCFIGVNTTLRDHITIGEKSVLGAGSVILSDVAPEGVYMHKATERSRVPSSKLRRI